MKSIKSAGPKSRDAFVPVPYNRGYLFASVWIVVGGVWAIVSSEHNSLVVRNGGRDRAPDLSVEVWIGFAILIAAGAIIAEIRRAANR